MVTVRHALSTKALNDKRTASKRFPGNRKPGTAAKNAITVLEAKATGAPIRSGKVIKPRLKRGYSPTT